MHIQTLPLLNVEEKEREAKVTSGPIRDLFIILYCLQVLETQPLLEIKIARTVGIIWCGISFIHTTHGSSLSEGLYFESELGLE